MKKKGFTLVELLVVITIIALLLSMMMPALKKAKGLARKAVCKSNLHQIGIALETYEMTYDNKRFEMRKDASEMDGYWWAKLVWNNGCHKTQCGRYAKDQRKRCAGQK